MNAVSGKTLRLAELFQRGAILADTDGDGLPDRLHALLVLGASATLPEHCAAVDLAARLAFETLALHLPLVASDPDALPDGRVPIFIGRRDALSSLCPPLLGNLLADLAPGEGLVASISEPGPALLVGGADAKGLAAAMQALVTSSLTAMTFATLPGQGENEGAGAPAGEIARIGAPWRAAGTPELVTSADLPPLRSLADLFGPAGLAIDTDDDLLPDRSRVTIVLPGDLAPEEAVAAAHLGARLGLEALGLALPLAQQADDRTTQAPGQIAIVIEQIDPTARLAPDTGTVRLQETAEGRQIVRVRGSSPSGRGAALAALAGLDAWAVSGRPPLSSLERDLNRLCALADPGAALAAVLPALEQLASVLSGPADAAVSLTIDAPAGRTVDAQAAAQCITHWAAQIFPGRPCAVEVVPAAQPTLLDESVRFTWEVDDAWAQLREAVLPALAGLPSDANWLIDLRLSEPEGRRQALRTALKEEIRATSRAAGNEQIRVLPAYHQGRAWLLEEVLPQLQALPVHRIVIRVQRFTSATEALEPPIRWLQDLFGVDELLAERLDLPVEAVRFELYDGPHTYEIDALDDSGQHVWHDSFSVVHTQWPYLRAFPAWGTVHPPTGCVRLWADAALIVDLPVAPDPERAWNYVQDRMLPALEAHIRLMCDGTPRPERQPFFAELTFDAWLSEADEALGVRQERSSPLENLHEDLYFIVLDFCSALLGSVQEPPYVPPWTAAGARELRSRQARLWTAPGRVVPRIHRRDGAAGEVRVRLTAAARQPVLRWRCDEASGTLPLAPASGVAVRVTGLDMRDEQQTLVLTLDGLRDACAHAHRILAGWADLRVSGALTATGPWAAHDLRLIIDGSLDLSIPAAGGASLPASLGATPTPEYPVLQETSGFSRPVPTIRLQPGATNNETVVPLPWDSVLGLAAIESQIPLLAAAPEVHAFEAGRSAGGLPSYALELTVPRKTGWWSRAKLCGWKATLLLNARHHANEPSSTSGLLYLAGLLTRDQHWRRVLDRVNVVLIPGENVDGMALYDSLQDEHPTWMHHAARYNAAGLEFVAAYTSPYTPHTEALVLPTLWRRWAPDIFCDDHGFPAHAWVQPFAGGSNPWFAAFFIPQALVYGIMPVPVSPRFPNHGKVADTLHTRLVAALTADPEIAQWNNDHADSYRTYANNWLPERFPATYDQGVLIHRSTYDPGERGAILGMGGLPGAFPGVTALSIVTEVADETAQGTYMALCARSHVIFDQVLLQYLYDANPPASVRRTTHVQPDGHVLLRAVRPRPLLLPGSV